MFFLWAFKRVERLNLLLIFIFDCRKATALATIHIQLRSMAVAALFGTTQNHYHMIFPHGKVSPTLIFRIFYF